MNITGHKLYVVELKLDLIDEFKVKQYRFRFVIPWKTIMQRVPKALGGLQETDCNQSRSVPWTEWGHDGTRVSRYAQITQAHVLIFSIFRLLKNIKVKFSHPQSVD